MFLSGQSADIANVTTGSIDDVKPVHSIVPHRVELDDNIETYIEYKLPDSQIDTSFKAYMDYRTITDKTSKQWELQQEAHTDENGFRRIGDDYCVAVTNYYAERECGTRLRVTLENETVFTATVADIKNPKQTDSMDMYHPVNEMAANVLEFVVDSDMLCDLAILLGSVSCLGLEGNIVKIERID